MADIGCGDIASDLVTAMNVRGTNDPNATKDECELLANIRFPLDGWGTSDNVFELKGYKYLRFYPTTTINKDGDIDNHGYFHLSRFRLYPAEVYQSTTAQSVMLGKLYTNLEAVVNAQKGLKKEEIQQEHYDALKKAYDAFMAKFVDPTELRNTMRDIDPEGVLATIRTGKNDPGFWTSKSAGDALKATYAAAVAYDKGGVYTTEQSADYVEKLPQQKKEVYASAIQIQEGKWYRIRFPKEEDFETYGWAYMVGEGYVNSDGVETTPSLFGKYVSVANLIVTDDGIQHIEPIKAENVAVGHTLHMLKESDMMTYADNALFRFIAVGDSAYMLQNKGTGMFLKATGRTGYVTLNAHPTLFNVNAVGCGLNIISAKDLTGTSQNNFHVQVSGNMLVTSGTNALETRSALYIEEAEDVAGSYDGTQFRVELNPGSLTGYCFPVEVSVPKGTDAQMWTVKNVHTLDEEGLSVSVTLDKIKGNVAAAGQPFILIYGDTKDYDAWDEPDMVVLKHGYEIGAKTAEADKILKGTFTGGTLASGLLMPFGSNSIVVNKRNNTSIAANSAYINPGWTANINAEVKLIFANEALEQFACKMVRLYSPATELYAGSADGQAPMVSDKSEAGIYYVTNEGHLWSYNQGRFTGNTAGIQPAAYGDKGIAWEISEAEGLSHQGLYNIWNDGNDSGYLVASEEESGAGSMITNSNAELLTVDSRNKAAWEIQEVNELPVTITETGYATLYSPVALNIPEEVTVYTGMVNEDKTVLTMNQVENVIPAETAVVLKGMPGNYSFGVAGMKGDDVDNDLEGTLAGIADANGILTLQDIDGIGFYRYTGGVLAGNKAYLSPDRAAGVKGLSFDFGLTDNITTVEGETTEKAVIYNLSGQRVEKAVQGVYIVNGKKVMVK